MEFLKKHYEKIILSAVVIGLGAAAFWLSIAVKEANPGAPPDTAPVAGVHGYKSIDLSTNRAALSALTNVPALVLSGEHNLFNPVTWKMRPNGFFFKILKEGAAVLTISDIRPLYFNIGFISKDRSGDTFKMYSSGQNSRESDTVPANLNEKSKDRPYIIRGIKGAADDPTGVDVELTDSGQIVSVTKDKPYQRITAYEADMKYEPETRTLNKQHVDDTFTIAGDPYKIIAITNNAVTVQDTRTTQKTTIQWTGAH